MGESLKRKIGPLPVWAWALIGGVALFIIRQRMAGGGTGGSSTQATAAEASLIQAEGQAEALQLQTPQILTQGESVYDPNSGALLGTNFTSGGMTNLDSSLINLIYAIYASRQNRGQNSSHQRTSRTKHPRNHTKTKAKPRGHKTPQRAHGRGGNTLTPNQTARGRGKDKLHLNIKTEGVWGPPGSSNRNPNALTG